MPEKQIGANRGAEYRNDEQQVIIVQRDSWHDCSDEHLPPWNLYRERNSHIKEQHERKTFQNWRVAVVRHEHLQQHRGCGEDQRVFVLETADNEIERLAHGGEVSRDVDRVRNNQKTYRN